MPSRWSLDRHGGGPDACEVFIDRHGGGQEAAQAAQVIARVRAWAVPSPGLASGSRGVYERATTTWHNVNHDDEKTCDVIAGLLLSRREITRGREAAPV
jgi:hypothetical protein